MSSGYYNGVAGQHAAALTQEIVAHNLANAQTAGFKGSREFVEALDHSLARSPGHQPNVEGSQLDLSVGPVRHTGRPLDIAIDGNHLLVIETEHGERYTRDGRLTLDADGKLVDMTGRAVLGENGPIIAKDGDARISESGAVYAGEQQVGRLRLVKAPDPSQLKPEGHGLYRAETDGPLDEIEEPRLRPNYVESANVDPIMGTVTLIETLRRFEAITRANQMLMGDMMQSLYDEMGRPVR